MKLRMMSWKTWVVAGILAVAVGAVAGPYIYIHYIEGEAPAPLTLSSSAPTSPSTTSVPLEGTWNVSTGSLVGYRVKEVLNGQSNTAYGRTRDVTGTISITGTTVGAGSFSADMATVESNQSRRDNQFRGRIMEVSTYPTATFKLTQPIELTTIPADGVQASTQATGELTLHGVTKTVTFTVTGKRSGGTIQVAGSIPVTFADYDIENPSFGFVTTEDRGILEFLLNFTQA